MSCNIWMGALFVLAHVYVFSASAGKTSETCVASFKPLLQVARCEEGCASNQEGSNDHRGRKKGNHFSRPLMESLLH